MHLLPEGTKQSPGVTGLSTHDHPCSIYESQDELRAQYVPFLQKGLLLGERCIFFVDEGSPEDVLHSMHDNGFDLKPYIATNAFKIISTTDTHLYDGFFGEEKMMSYWLQSLDEAHRAGYPAMRAAVEMTWALSGKPGCEILAPYEARLNKFTDDNKVSVLCAYHRGKFSAQKLKAVIQAHPLVINGNRLLENPLAIPGDKFLEGDAQLELQAMLDGLELISRLSVLNAKLQRQEERYQELYLELHSLARTVSHELQEPINVVVSYLRLLSVRYTDRLGDDADEFIARSVAGAKTVGRMIDDLWIYSRIESRPEEEVDCLQVLGDVLDELKDELEIRRAEITCSKLPHLVVCREHVKYIFRQLVENATKHSGVRPRIFVSAIETNTGWQFAVSDNGPGIDPLHESDVFQIFNRLGKRPDESGSGMGLAIAKRMIEHHNGRIWFQSKPAAGTTFYFTLPGGVREPLTATRQIAS